MARRATGIAKASAPTKAGRLADSTRALAGTPPALRAIPVALAPLLAPYKKVGRLSIRIERMPQLARLSAGRNNGDCSWSLTFDELEDLAYLVPEGMDEKHNLDVRVIAHEDGSTLAVLDLAISPEGEGEAVAAGGEGDSGEHTELRLLRDELAKAKANFAARELDIEIARQDAEQKDAELAKQKVAAELAAARAVWEAEMEGRLAAAAQQAVSTLEKDRAAAEEAARVAEEARVEAERARTAKAEKELARLREELANTKTALGKAKQSADEADADFSQDKPEAKSGRGKKAEGDDDKFASLTAGLLVRQDEAWRAAAKSPSGTWPEPQGDSSPDGFLVSKGAARPSSVATPTADFTFAERSNGWGETTQNAPANQGDIPLPAGFQYTHDEVQKLLADELELWRQDFDEALAEAESGWKTEEAARLAAAQTQWQEEVTLAAARSQTDSARDQALETEVDRLLGECANLGATLSKREAALAEANRAVQEARESAEREAKESQAKAEAAWKRDEAARTAALNAEWQVKAAKAVADLSVAAEAQDRESRSELDKLRKDLAVAQATLADRQSALVRAGLATEEAHARMQQELDAALANARTSWKSEEAERIAALEAQWKERSARTTAELGAQVEARNRDSKSELDQLRAELAAAQAGLADRQNALVRAGLATEEAHARMQQELAAGLTNARAAWKTEEAERIAALEAQWNDRGAKAIAELRAQAEAQEKSAALELARMREELAAAQAGLVDRQNALVKAGLATGEANERWQREMEAALAAAKASWKAEEASKFAAAEAAWQERSAKSLDELRAQSDAKDQGFAREMESLREELKAAHAQLAERQDALVGAGRSMEEANQRWQQQLDATLAKAKTDWQAQEAAKLSALDAQWQEAANKLAAEAQSYAKAKAAGEQTHEEDMRRLKDAVTAMQAALADRESQLARATVAADAAQQRLQHEAAEALAKAEAAWKAGEVERVAAADAQSRKQIANAFAEMTIQCERAETALAQAGAQADAFAAQDRELHRTKQELTAAQAALAERDAALARLKTSADEVQKRYLRDMQETMSRAETVWKADEAARLAAAEALWQENANKRVAEAQAQPDDARGLANEAELRQLREELAASQAALADRKAALVRAGMAIEQTRERWQNEMEATLAKAKAEWKTDQAARLAAVEAQWQEKTAKALAEANARGSGMDLRNLREELAAMQATLWERDIELAVARAAREEERKPITPEEAIVLTPDRIGELPNTNAKPAPRAKFRTIRDIAAAAALAASAMVSYPHIAAFLSGPEATSTAAEDASDADANMAVVNHAANVRVDASGSAAVIATLPRGTKVAVLEKRGAWTQVRIADEIGKTEPKQGWVATSFLDAPNADAKGN
jgi:hypothetical protein